jgi:hypothetical protein
LLERVRYVTTRDNHDGTKRYYWQRKGRGLIRLSDDPTTRYEQQFALNASADRNESHAMLELAQDDEKAYLPGTIGWIIARYKKTTEFTECAPGTKKYYLRFLQEIFELGPHVPFEKMGPTETQDFILSYGAVHSQRKAKAVLGNLFSAAIFATAKMPKPVRVNWCSEVTVSETPSRSVVWEDSEIDVWLAAADKHRHGEEMKVAMALLRYTAQRPNDCLNMKTSRFTGRLIALKQEKTDLLIDVPCHRDLRAVLETHLAERDGLFLVPSKGGRFALPYPTFSRWFAEIRALAKLRDELQPRDLRRTAMVRMNEAGAELRHIAAVSGHTISQTMKILETYLPATFKMAQSAVAAWEKSGAAAAAPVAAGTGFSAEKVAEMRERFGLTDQQIALLQLTALPSQSNADADDESNI